MSEYFDFDDFVPNSEGYKKVVSCFNESVAKRIVEALSNRTVLPKVQEFEEISKIVDDWLAKYKQVDNLLTIWKALPHYTWTYPQYDEFKDYGLDRIELHDGEHNAKFYDKEFSELVFTGHKGNQVQRAVYKPYWKAYLFGNEKLIIVAEVLGEILQLKPLKEIEPTFNVFHGEIKGMKRAGDLLLISFVKSRTYPHLGSYLLALNPVSGKIVYQRTE
jgi:hypothetical protein